MTSSHAPFAGPCHICNNPTIDGTNCRLCSSDYRGFVNDFRVHRRWTTTGGGVTSSSSACLSYPCLCFYDASTCTRRYLTKLRGSELHKRSRGVGCLSGVEPIAAVFCIFSAYDFSTRLTSFVIICSIVTLEVCKQVSIFSESGSGEL